MSRIRARGEKIRKYIIEKVEQFPKDIAKRTAEKFEITRQAVNKHLRSLVDEGCLTETGETRNRVYKLRALSEWARTYDRGGLEEHVVWQNDVLPQLGPMPDNVRRIWNYGFTEMFNNALDHSQATVIRVAIARTAATTEMVIGDNGVGIFRKIQHALSLADERHAILELSKGKLTTDPAHHTGEGIFFSSRMFDQFDILSGGVFYSHEFGEDLDWVLERDRANEGTWVLMKLNNHTATTTQKIFDQYADTDHGFTTTVVPVKLARYGNDQLLSRSQAKRLLARVELFKVVLFDFKDVEEIGQAFADEIFRVFANQHPEITVAPIHANSAVKRMIERVKSNVVQGAASSNVVLDAEASAKG